MRVLVCGSRRWRDRDKIVYRLADLTYGNPEVTVVHGMAAGADKIAHQEAQKLGFLVEPHPWQPFVGPGVPPKRAPLERNKHMVELGADLCLAFWDGRSTGTKHTIDLARKAGIPVEVVEE